MSSKNTSCGWLHDTEDSVVFTAITQVSDQIDVSDQLMDFLEEERAHTFSNCLQKLYFSQ